MGVPGEILGYFKAKERFGSSSISMKRLFEPTIKLCKKGIRISRSLYTAIVDKKDLIKSDPTFRYALYITKMQTHPIVNIRIFQYIESKGFSY